MFSIPCLYSNTCFYSHICCYSSEVLSSGTSLFISIIAPPSQPPHHPTLTHTSLPRKSLVSLYPSASPRHTCLLSLILRYPFSLSLLFLITAHKTFPFLAIEIQLLGIMDSALMLNTLFMGQISRKEYRIHYRTTSNKLFFSGNVVYPKGFKPTLPPPSTPFSGHSLKCELLLQNNVHTCIQYIFFFL